MEGILIHNFPLPPSENAMYRNVPGVGRVAARELVEYRRACNAYGLRNAGKFSEIRAILKSRWKDFEHYKVDYFFVFKRERLYTKATKKERSRPKKLDVANRIKAAQDCLFAILEVDDKHIWATSIEKLDGEVEGVHVVIHPHTPINAEELTVMFQGEPAPSSKLFS